MSPTSAAGVSDNCQPDEVDKAFVQTVPFPKAFVIAVLAAGGRKHHRAAHDRQRWLRRCSAGSVAARPSRPGGGYLPRNQVPRREGTKTSGSGRRCNQRSQSAESIPARKSEIIAEVSSQLIGMSFGRTQ